MRSLFVVSSAALLLVVGCHSPMPYSAPREAFNARGPSIAVLAVRDQRPEKKHTSEIRREVQEIVAAELSGMNAFSTVSLATNEADHPNADLLLTPELHLLEAGLPDVQSLRRKQGAIAAATGLIGTAIYASTGITAQGNAVIAFYLHRSGFQGEPLTFMYDEFVTNRMSKASADSASGQAQLMALALKQPLERFKRDLQMALPQAMAPGNAE